MSDLIKTDYHRSGGVNMCETNRRREIITKIRSGEISCPDTCPIADKCERPKGNYWGSVTRQIRCADRIMKAEVK